MRSKYYVLALLTVIVCVLGGCSPDSKSYPQPQGPFTVSSGQSTAQIACFHVIKAKSPIHVPFALINPTDEVVVYGVQSAKVVELYGLDGNLYTDGKIVKRQVIYDRMQFDKERIKKLEPNETAMLYYTLPFVEIKPGKYELRLKYEIVPKSVDETKFGLTAMKLEQTILLDVRD